MRKIIKFLCLFCFIYVSEEQVARCDYGYKNYWTIGYVVTNVSYYTCTLNTEKANYDEKLTRIDGQHISGHTDIDVKYINNYVSTKLKIFSSIFCQKFPNLEVIYLGIQLEKIDEDSLLNCKSLNMLTLNNNKIQELPEYLLIRNSKLTYVWINYNQLTTLPENSFLNQKELDHLYFIENRINFLPSNIFRPLTKLRVLYLFDNKLQSLNPEWFVSLQNLKWLRLERNLFSEIPSKCFAFLKNLDDFYIFENKVYVLHSDSFDGLENLKILNMNSNKISNLPTKVFTPLKNLKKLYLNDNKLATISSNSFGVQNQLTHVWLKNNKISSIDQNFIDYSEILYLDMTNNNCSQSEFQSKTQIKLDLKACFANYQPLTKLNQNPGECGQSVIAQGNIIGGEKIKRGSYPWIAALLRPNGKLFCGGVLVSNRKVVTAAHCIFDKGQSTALLPRSIIVLLGFYDLSQFAEIGRDAKAVQTINIHPDWNPLTTSYDADIAVLILHRDVTFNEHIQPICMATIDSNIRAATEGIVVGNGKGGLNNEYENIPKILKMPIQTARRCTEKDYVFKNLLTGRTFCAGTGTGQGVCTGDSGSAFVVKIGNKFYLRGIVSASLDDSLFGCDVNSYSVFTDALKYVNWINELSTEPKVEMDDRIIFI